MQNMVTYTGLILTYILGLLVEHGPLHFTYRVRQCTDKSEVDLQNMVSYISLTLEVDA